MKLAELQIRQGNLAIRPEGLGNVNKNKPGQGPDGSNKTGEQFGDVLTRKLSDDHSVKFSAHAAKRMYERNIELGDAELARLSNGMEKAREKGAESSLILVDNNAYVVSVKNQTVITALNREMAQGNVFSNIDSVAIV